MTGLHQKAWPAQGHCMCYVCTYVCLHMNVCVCARTDWYMEIIIADR